MTDAYKLMAARLEGQIARFHDEIERDLFRSDPVVMPSFWAMSRPSAWARRLARVRGYVVNVWSALRGDDPYSEDEY